MNRRLIIVAASGGHGPGHRLAASLAQAFEQRSWRVDVCDAGERGDRGTPRVLVAARRAVTESRDRGKPTLVLLGHEAHQRRLVWAMASAGLLTGLRLVVHAWARLVPYDPSLSDLFGLADLIVADSAFGARAVTRCAAEGMATLRRGVVTIAPALNDVALGFADVRDSLRQDIFDVAPDQLLIGCGAGGQSDPRPFVAMQIFRAFADGLYWTCTRCERTTDFAYDDGLSPIPVTICAVCGAREGRPGIRWPGARLFLTNEPSAPPRLEDGLGAWTVAGIRCLLGLEGRVLVEGDDRLPPTTSCEAMNERLACLDVHLLPHHLADVELALLASCAMGVPAVTTRFGAAEDLLAGAASLVPPAMTLDDSAGHRIALMDVGGGVRELLRLAQDPVARDTLGDAARAAMRMHDHRVVVPQWVDHLERPCDVF